MKKRLLALLLTGTLLAQSGLALAAEIDIDVGDEEITEDIVIDDGKETTEASAPEANTTEDASIVIDEETDSEEATASIQEIDVSAEESTATTVNSSGTCGNNLTWTLDDEGTLTISGTGAMSNWESYIATPWHDHYGQIKKIIIGFGITTIGDHAFDFCFNLRSVTIPDSVTIISDYAFASCYKLTSVVIPNSVTSIGSYAFSGCDLTDVTIPTGVTSIGYGTFSGCSFTKLTIPNNVTSIGERAFINCYDLTNVTIGNNVTSIGESAFDSCTSLTSVTIPNSVTSIGDFAFFYCNKLTDVYYVGSEEKWKEISIGVYNNNLTDATIHYNPGENGNSNETEGLRYIEDTWSFSNPTSKISVITYGMFFDTATAKSLQKANNGSRGHCAGMAMTTMATYLRFPRISSYGNYSNLNEIKKNYRSSELNCTAINYIDYGFTYQFTPAFARYKNSTKNDYEGLYNAVYAFQHHNGQPVYVSIGTGSGGHALVGLAISEETETATKVLVYDCNHPNEKCYLTLNGTKGSFTGWSYGYGLGLDSTQDGARTNYVMMTSNFIEDFDKDYTYENNPTILMRVSRWLSGIIHYNGESITVEDIDETDSSSIIPISADIGINNSSYDNYWLSGGGKEVSFESLSENTEIALSYDDLEVSAQSSSACDLTMDIENQTVEIDGEKDAKFDVNYEISSDYKKSVVQTISGVSSGEVEIKQENDNSIIATGMEECSVTISSKVDNDEGESIVAVQDKISVSDMNELNSYQISIDETNNETSTTISEDTNGDGTYDTVIASTEEHTHTWDSGKVTKPETCTADGVKTYTCTVCGETKTKAITKLGHKYGSWTVTTKPTCTEKGEETRVCANDSSHKETRSIDALGHRWDTGKVTKAATCGAAGVKTYTCSRCKILKTETIPATGNHTYKTTTTKAKPGANGKTVRKCSVCGKVSTTTIYAPKTLTLSTTSYTYNGKTKKPTVKVKDSKGNTISSTHYTVSYASGRKYVGKYKVTVKFRSTSSKYTGTMSTYFKINPKGTTLKTPTAGSKSFTAKWTKQSTQTSGYQLQYSTSSKFTSAKTVTISSNKTISKKITKLTAKKKYYVRIRTYKTVSGTKYYSAWSSTKTVTTKK